MWNFLNHWYIKKEGVFRYVLVSRNRLGEKITLDFLEPPLLLPPLFSFGPVLPFGFITHALLNLDDASSTSS